MLTDVAAVPCWVEGTASVVPLDARRQVLTVAVVPPTTTPAKVLLAPGGHASEYLGYGSDGVPAAGQDACGPEEPYFEVTPPGGTRGAVVPGWHRDRCEDDDVVTGDLVPGSDARP